MSDEQQYSSGPEAGSNKRKYEDQPPLSSGGRRPTGFSSPPDSAPRSYNSVPPPLEGIEIAKQRAQEIAARLTAASSGPDAKRPRVENGSGGFDNERGFSSAPPGIVSQLSLLSAYVNMCMRPFCLTDYFFNFPCMINAPIDSVN